jgi:anti-sigma28 factor (negative regulator of flagellin synthesis)
MMGKINIDKTKSFEPIRPERQSEVKTGHNTPIRPPHAAEASGKKDRVDVSGKASEVGKFVGLLNELPQIRAEKVKNIRAQIASEAFDPTNGEIADAIIKEEKI